MRCTFLPYSLASEVQEVSVKTAHARPLPRSPTARRPGLPRTRHVETALRITLALVLSGTAVWFWLAAPNGAVFPATLSAEPEAGLELLLSGAVTSSLSLGAAEMADLEAGLVRCDASGFRIASPPGAAFPLELTFSGIPEDAGSLYTLGSRGDVTLRVSGVPYTLLSGTLTTTPGGHTFYASFVDARSQPLQLSGRLVCP